MQSYYNKLNQYADGYRPWGREADINVTKWVIIARETIQRALIPRRRRDDTSNNPGMLRNKPKLIRNSCYPYIADSNYQLLLHMDNRN